MAALPVILAWLLLNSVFFTKDYLDQSACDSAANMLLLALCEARVFHRELLELSLVFETDKQ